MEMMRAISMWQPWASLWLSPAKFHETRHWPITKNWVTEVPFQLVVHAAKKKISDDLDPLVELQLEKHFGLHWREKLPRGAIIGRVTILSSLSMMDTVPEHDADRACGYWSPERFAWRRGAYSVLTKPIPYRGHQKMFSIPADFFEE